MVADDEYYLLTGTCGPSVKWCWLHPYWLIKNENHRYSAMLRKKPYMKTAYTVTRNSLEQSGNIHTYNDSQNGSKKLAVGF